MSTGRPDTAPGFLLDGEHLLVKPARGLHVVAVDVERRQHQLCLKEHYDLRCRPGVAGAALGRALRALPGGLLVLVALQDSLGKLGRDALRKALGHLGGAISDDAKSYALIARAEGDGNGFLVAQEEHGREAVARGVVPRRAGGKPNQRSSASVAEEESAVPAVGGAAIPEGLFVEGAELVMEENDLAWERHVARRAASEGLPLEVEERLLAKARADAKWR